MQQHILSLVMGAVLLFLGQKAFSSIQEINSFNEIKDLIERVDPSTLVIFDCDETILVPTDPYLFAALQNHSVVKEIQAEFIRHAATKEDPLDYSEAISAEIYTKVSYRAVEQSMVDTINRLCQSGIKVIALTAQGTGPVWGGRVPRFEEWRYERLQRLGIDLSKSFPEQSIRFDKFPAPPRGIPVFYKGILCSSSYPKGVVLAAFLDHIGHTPDNVIFVDDRPEFVQSVALAMKHKRIPFQGYIYRAAEFQVPDVDAIIMRFQLDHIKKHNRVITYEEAQQLSKISTIIY